MNYKIFPWNQIPNSGPGNELGLLFLQKIAAEKLFEKFNLKEKLCYGVDSKVNYLIFEC